MKPKTSKKGAKKSNKKSLKVEMVDTVAIVYEIPNEKHPFHRLDGVYGSIDLDSCEIDSKDVIFFLFYI